MRVSPAFSSAPAPTTCQEARLRARAGDADALVVRVRDREELGEPLRGVLGRRVRRRSQLAQQAGCERRDQ